MQSLPLKRAVMWKVSVLVSKGLLSLESSIKLTSLLHINNNFKPIAKHRWKNNCIILLRKHYLYSMFVFVRTKLRLLLVCPVRNDIKISNQQKVLLLNLCCLLGRLCISRKQEIENRALRHPSRYRRYNFKLESPLPLSPLLKTTRC